MEFAAIAGSGSDGTGAVVLNDNPKLQVYNGRCHCGFVRFKVAAAIDHVRECNCSVCSKRGALIFRVPENALEIITPLEGLHLYQWGTNTARDYICHTCAILTFRRPRTLTAEERVRGYKSFEGWAINTRCLEGFDPTSVPTIHVDGKSLGLN